MKKPSPLVPDLTVIVWTITASYRTGTVAPIIKQKKLKQRPWPLLRVLAQYKKNDHSSINLSTGHKLVRY